jgi:hypothetical protein
VLELDLREVEGSFDLVQLARRRGETFVGCLGLASARGQQPLQTCGAGAQQRGAKRWRQPRDEGDQLLHGGLVAELECRQSCFEISLAPVFVGDLSGAGGDRHRRLESLLGAAQEAKCNPLGDLGCGRPLHVLGATERFGQLERPGE